MSASRSRGDDHRSVGGLIKSVWDLQQLHATRRCPAEGMVAEAGTVVGAADDDDIIVKRTSGVGYWDGESGPEI